MQLVDAAKMAELRKTMANLANGGVLTCPQARAIAEQFDVSKTVVGQLADELKIKIRNCELGCF
ncbi:MAG: hypothetical protein PHC60_07215 [Heliobacteriaceae bacterium]|nr:hypothetical protein [Heliobacteriaceae bacterium]MDD4588160.1 hypothetical protein [Heliobacteriaceae bacterium]